MYSIKEIYLTIQGEGAHTGRTSVFVRFAGCNLWSGLEDDRLDAVCSFCDTDFVGTDGVNGGKYRSPDEVIQKVLDVWSPRTGSPWIVLTGGEPMLQVDEALIDAAHRAGCQVAIETNGTLAVAPGIDWVCVSPKEGADLVVTSGDELKLVYPQPGLAPSDFEGLAFGRFSLQPLDGPEVTQNTVRAVDYVMKHPRWQLSVQAHKIVGIK